MREILKQGMGEEIKYQITTYLSIDRWIQFLNEHERMMYINIQCNLLSNMVDTFCEY